MVILKNICLSAFALAAAMSVIPNPAEACGKSELIGRVKSIIVTETLVDPMTSKSGAARLAFRSDVSNDGRVEETTLYSAQRAGEVNSKLTSFFENSRLVRQTQVAGDKTISTANCSYDAQGRVSESRTQSVNGERNIIETFEYGAGFIKRRSLVRGRWYVKTQTLDRVGRIIREVELDEETSNIVQTTEVAYRGDREERCTLASNDSQRAWLETGFLRRRPSWGRRTLRTSSW